MWTAELITAHLNGTQRTVYPVYWNLTNDKKDLRITIDVYKADKTTLEEAKKQVKELLTKLNTCPVS